MKYSKWIVAIVITLNVAFAIACFIWNWNGVEIPDELISSWFMFTGTELLAMAGIKITETIRTPADKK
jgi:hypothetical protein